MNIIPKPLRYTALTGKFVLRNDSLVYADSALQGCAQYFVNNINSSNIVHIDMCTELTNADVHFCLPESKDNALGDGYEINMAGDKINVVASNDIGGFAAVQTLLQVLQPCDRPDILQSDNCHIADSPKYKWRALHLDVARHFFDVNTVKTILNAMAEVKLNVLHLHLSDDQGFRVEIDKYPNINKVASYRQGTEIVKDGQRYVDDKPYGGYFTKAQLRDIVSYARKLRIEVIPEIDIPGHCVALLAAYPEYGCRGEGYEVRKKWGISKDILCAGNDNTLQFVCDILDEVTELFDSPYVHLGGDEAPKDRWCNCKRCQAKLSELRLTDYNALQSWLVNGVVEHLKTKGKKVICWNDGVNSSLDKSVVVQHWKPATIGSTVKAINSGRQAIMSSALNVYFDYPYAATPLYRTYRYKVMPRGVKKDNRNNILGVEGAVWTEYIADNNKLFFNLLPRLWALAECAWGTNDSYHDFKSRSKQLCSKYIDKGFVCNTRAYKHQNVFSRLITMRKCWKKDSYEELNTYLSDTINNNKERE